MARNGFRIFLREGNYALITMAYRIIINYDPS